MDFMKLFIGIPFAIVFALFIISLRNDIFKELKLWVKAVITISSLVPIWGVVFAFFGMVYFARDVKNANARNRIFRPSKINIWLFGEEKCYKK